MQSNFYKNNNIISCPVSTRKNIVSGYTVEYATAARSLAEDTVVEYASAGGLVVLPANRPISEK